MADAAKLQLFTIPTRIATLRLHIPANECVRQRSWTPSLAQVSAHGIDLDANVSDCLCQALFGDFEHSRPICSLARLVDVDEPRRLGGTVIHMLVGIRGH